MSDPDWTRLPHDPRGFFELAAEFDRKELKRRYNALIKVYKPERHPAEFQRIRGAYEALDQQLRYGADASVPIELPKYDWTAVATPVVVSPATPGEVSPPPAVARPWHERLRDEPPEALLAELKAIETKQPFHFYAIALLEDALPEAEPQTFLKGLLRGLQRHPHDPGLSELVTQYLRTEAAVAMAPAILRAVAKVIRTDRYYFLTEGLWDRYLREAPFEEFRATLEACEQQLTDHRIAGRVAFYVHLLKPALWLADEGWIDKLFAFIEREGAKFAFRFEGDLELLQQLREFLASGREAVGSNPLRQEMEGVLRSYCLDPEPVFDQKFLAVTVRMGQQIDEVLDAFPVQLYRDPYATLYRVWMWLDYEVGERHGIPFESDEQGKYVKRARGFFTRVQALTDRTTHGWVWQITGLLYLLMKGGIYVLALAMGVGLAEGFLAGNSLGSFAVVLRLVAVVISLGLGWVLDQYVGVPNYHRFCRYWGRVTYRNVWRPELVPFVKQLPLTYAELLEVLHAAEDNHLLCPGWINLFARIDYGLAFVGLAQRYAT